ncbi:MAG TPA: hypothetical protein VMF50_09330 [Candidatus Binataceae bacterium]|nr:hypothetical protein [Candidatus Binataceae bacterium]
MGLIEFTYPGGANRIVDPCAQCRKAEGVWSVAWPGLPDDALYLVCSKCLWRKFHEVPKGIVRSRLVRRVFHGRVFGRASI